MSQPSHKSSVTPHIKRYYPYQVLLVEDDTIAQKVVEELFKALQCQVAVASTGEAAVEKAARHYYDLIIMDIGLPDIDGCEATRRIRQSQCKLPVNIPIVALTAHVDTDRQHLYLDAGMNAVFNKPLKKCQAKEIIQQFIVPHRSQFSK